ncbi:uncharacterized protein [Dermacentor andersoni]|uniref:uncharacterized protein n=1 Tax=Dermacentor andersoni TaxID=34620 RepID=UPI002155F0E6|nr:uncharacterized protein LOC126516651 [Dermacentor andersoni]
MSSLENVQSLQDKLLMLNLLTTSQLSKSLSAFASQLDPQNVVRFFKCMESSCDFCTDKEDNFKDHLRVHVDLAHCTYCNEVAVNEQQLVEHMVTEHGSCRFQCALCFYRSQTVTHMRVHGIMVHSSKAVFWYMCKEKAPLNPKLAGHEKDHIGGYMCKDCSFKSHCTERFFEHLAVIHSGFFTIPCHVCSAQMDSPNSLIDHYTEMHNIHAFHCLYCDFGSQFDWDVIVHVTMCHPAKPFKIFCRGKELPPSFRTLKDLERSNINDGIPASFSSLSPPHSLKDEWQQSAQDKKPNLDLDVDVKVPVKNDVLRKYGNTGKDGLKSVFAMSETKCKCSAIFNDVAMFFQHLTEKHVLEHRFDCPKCVHLKCASVDDLFAHFVDLHTAFLRCCYKSCVFLGESQQGIDDHVIQVHQHFDLPQEEATEADHEETYPHTGSGIACPDSLECTEKKDEHLLERGVVYTCSLCCQTEMEPLDYFRHMSLGHGIKFFCGHCKKGYKLWKQMMMHHSRCHSELELSVKSFERNKVKDVTSELQSDCNNEGQGGVENKLAKSKDIELKIAGNTARSIVAMKPSKRGFRMTASRSATRIYPRKRHISSLSTALHYARTHKKTLLSSSEGSKHDLDKFRLLQPIPLGKIDATCSQQKKDKGHLSYFIVGQQKHPDEFRQTDQTKPENNRSAIVSPCASGSSVPQMEARKSPITASAHHRRGPSQENAEKARQPRSDCKPSFFCGHCFKSYRLLKPLITHQKSVHCGLPFAIRKLHMEKLEDITNDDVVKKYRDMATTKNVQPGDSILVGEEVCKVPSSDDADDADFEQSSCESQKSPSPKVKQKWRRIKLAYSESEDDEACSASQLSSREGFSYYGKPVEPIDFENIYVRFYDGDFRIVYYQLAGIVNVCPIVLVRKEIIM